MEREAIGGKCIGGLQLTSCAVIIDERASTSSTGAEESIRSGSSGHSNSQNNIFSGNSSSSSGGNTKNINASFSSNYVNDNANKIVESVRNSGISQDESYLLILRRRLLKNGEVGGTKVGKGDRVLISLERDYDSKSADSPDMDNQHKDKDENKVTDIEDLSGMQSGNFKNFIHTNPKQLVNNIDTKPIYSNTANTNGTNKLIPNPATKNGLILFEPNIAVGKGSSYI